MERLELMFCKTIKEVDESIKLAEINRERWVEATWHKDQASDLTFYGRELNRLYKLREFLNLKVNIEPHASGFLIEHKFVVAFQKNKWRVKGKNKWYWYKNEKELVDKYIRCNTWT
jgi:hypothetical protein